MDTRKLEEAITNEPVSLERANKQKVLSDITSLMENMDKCENELVKAKLTDDISRLVNAYCEVSRLVVAAHQELSFLYDYIKEGGEYE